MIQKRVKSILNKHKKRDEWFLDDYSVNPYEGCSCNCLYCYIRGSQYGVNMEQGLSIKDNALQILERQLHNKAKKNEFGFVAVGSATDAYMHHEAHYRMTEAFLQLLLKYRFPVFISTKRTLILRDIQLLKEIDRNAILPVNLQDKIDRGLILSVSISSMAENITNMLEPGAAAPARRLELVHQLKEQNFLVGVNAIPILPFISDSMSELEKIIAAAKQYGADYIMAGGLTLFGHDAADSKTLYYKFLEKNYPDLIEKYKTLYGSNYTLPRQYHSALQKKVKMISEKYQIRNNIFKTIA